MLAPEKGPHHSAETLCRVWSGYGDVALSSSVVMVVYSLWLRASGGTREHE